jgi:tripartite-type tricarboxylate transporter receptor subunit TctC
MKDTKSLLLDALRPVVMMSMVSTLPTFVFAAESYPVRPIRLVIPTSAGGTQDLLARLITPRMSERLGKQIIVDSRPGAGQIIGTEIVANATPDGYTLLLAAGVHAIQPVIRKLAYDPVKSFSPIALTATVPFVLVVNPSVAVNTVEELIALAKQKPGKVIFAATGVGVTPHMSMELFRLMAGIDVLMVHFKGQGPTITDLLGGHSHASINSIPAFLPHITSGKLKALGVTTAKRSDRLPDVPTIAEAGVPGYETKSWYGLFAPAGTPASIVDRLNREIRATLETDDMKKLFANAGLEMDYLGPAEFERFVRGEMKTWQTVAKKANIKAE